MTNDPRFSAAPPVPGVANISRASASLVSGEAVAYLQQVYALLAGSLILSVAAGYTGMSLPFALEHPILLIVLQFAALFLAMYVKNTATLFLFTGISGLALGPLLAAFVHAGLSSVVGEAVFMTGGVFTGLTFYALTTKRDLSMMSGMLFAGLMVILVGGLINLFVQSSIVSLAMAAMGAVIFSGFIVYETQQLKQAPWVIPPAVAALSMYLNILNLFLDLLRLLAAFTGGKDD